MTVVLVSQAGFRTISILAIAAFALLSFLAPDGTHPAIVVPCLIAVYAVLWDAFTRPVHIRAAIPTFVTPESLFVAFAYVLYFLPYQLQLLGLFDPTLSRFVGETFTAASNRAVALSAAGLLAFYLGARWHGPRRASPADPSIESMWRHLPALTTLALAGLILIYWQAGWRAAGEGRYTGTSTGGALADGMSLLIVMFSMISAILPGLWRTPWPPALWAGVALATGWAGYLLGFGDRNGALLIGLSALGSALSFRRPLSRPVLLLAMLAALAVYGWLETARLPQGSQDIDPQGTRPYETSFVISTIGTRAAIDTVPDTVGFGYGLYKAVGLAGVVPLIRGVVIGDAPTMTTTAEILTAAMLPPDAGWSVGTTVVADLYIDFGIPGVILGLFAIGRFADWVRHRATARPASVPRAITYVLTLALFAQLPRYAADFPLRILVWSALFLTALRLLATRPAPLAQRPEPEGARL